MQRAGGRHASWVVLCDAVYECLPHPQITAGAQHIYGGVYPLCNRHPEVWCGADSCAALPFVLQALLYGVTLTNSDLGAPYGPLPRQNPPSVVPFCLGLFNFGTLDDFAKFVQERSVKNNTEDFFDDNRQVAAAAAAWPRFKDRASNAGHLSMGCFHCYNV